MRSKIAQRILDSTPDSVRQKVREQSNKMVMEKTCRGFSILYFKDRSNNICSLQKSSIAAENCVWLGIDDKDLQAQQITDFNSVNTRMHLTQDQVKELITVLQKFVDTGDI